MPETDKDDKELAEAAFQKLLKTMYPPETILKPHVEGALRECFAAGYVFGTDPGRFEILLDTPGKWN